MTNKRLTLCADDFALSPPVCAGILELVQAGRLQAVSCMTSSPLWPVEGARLRELPGCELGLHLNFTAMLGDADPVQPLGRIIAGNWLGSLPLAQVRASLQRQWQQFVHVVGREPDFIDGHEHVHQFPRMRAALWAEIEERHYRGWIRVLGNIQAPQQYWFKVHVLKWLGGYALTQQCQQRQQPCNRAFAGVYDFAPQADYRSLMRQWLAACPDGSLLMCHPAQAGADDSIAAARLREFNYLRSAEFAADCAEFGVQLTPLSGVIRV